MSSRTGIPPLAPLSCSYHFTHLIPNTHLLQFCQKERAKRNRKRKTISRGEVNVKQATAEHMLPVWLIILSSVEMEKLWKVFGEATRKEKEKWITRCEKFISSHSRNVQQKRNENHLEKVQSGRFKLISLHQLELLSFTKCYAKEQQKLFNGMKRNRLSWTNEKFCTKDFCDTLKCSKRRIVGVKQKGSSRQWATPIRPRWNVKKEGNVKVCPAHQTSEGKNVELGIGEKKNQFVCKF